MNRAVSDAVKLHGCHYNVLMTVVSKCVGVIEMGLMTVVGVWVSLKWGL